MLGSQSRDFLQESGAGKKKGGAGAGKPFLVVAGAVAGKNLLKTATRSWEPGLF